VACGTRGYRLLRQVHAQQRPDDHAPCRLQHVSQHGQHRRDPRAEAQRRGAAAHQPVGPVRRCSLPDIDPRQI